MAAKTKGLFNKAFDTEFDYRFVRATCKAGFSTTYTAEDVAAHQAKATRAREAYERSLKAIAWAEGWEHRNSASSRLGLITVDDNPYVAKED